MFLTPRQPFSSSKRAKTGGYTPQWILYYNESSRCSPIFGVVRWRRGLFLIVVWILCMMDSGLGVFFSRWALSMKQPIDAWMNETLVVYINHPQTGQVPNKGRHEIAVYSRDNCCIGEREIRSLLMRKRSATFRRNGLNVTPAGLWSRETYMGVIRLRWRRCQGRGLKIGLKIR